MDTHTTRLRMNYGGYNRGEVGKTTNGLFLRLWRKLMDCGLMDKSQSYRIETYPEHVKAGGESYCRGMAHLDTVLVDGIGISPISVDYVAEQTEQQILFYATFFV